MHAPRWNSDPRLVGTLGALVVGGVAAWWFGDVRAVGFAVAIAAWYASLLTLAFRARSEHAAREWLAQLDGVDPRASWSAASEEFRAAVPLSTWSELFRARRAALGHAVGRRTLVAIRGHMSARDLVVELKSEGIAHPPLEERVFLRPSALQSWSVVRYSARTSLAARNPLALDAGVDAHAAT
jgi:hypothetical protein